MAAATVAGAGRGPGPLAGRLLQDVAKRLLSLSAGIAPNITRGPLDSTVIDGMSVVLACETSGAPRPAITWQKGRWD